MEVDGEEYAATAGPTAGDGRDALFARIAAQFFAGHQAGTDRTIPVVELVR